MFLLVLSFLLPAPASAASATDENAFVAQVNATRAARGLAPLTINVELINLARSWSTQMSNGACGEGNYICHASPISAGVTQTWAKLGENVGTGPNVSSIMDAFIASPGHFANIIDPEFTHIGVGVVWDGERMFTTHRFMSLQSVAPTTTAAPPTTAAPTTTATPTTAAPATTTPATTTAPTTTQAATPTTNTTPAALASTSDGGSLTTPEPSPGSGVGADPAPAERASVEVFEVRAPILIDAFKDLS